MIIKTDSIFPQIHDNTKFIKNHPKLHPHSSAYEQYWMKELDELIYGMWETEETPEGERWRYMNPQLNYFTNYHTITIQDGKQRILSRPNLLDINWTLFNCWFICRGFSGFEDDEEYTSNWTVKLKYDKLSDENLPDIPLKYLNNLTDNCYKKDGTLKTYVDPLEYLNSTHSKSLGHPLYENNSLNLFLLGSRSGGKSFMASAIMEHEWVTDGAKTVEDYLSGRNKVEIFCGSANSAKSSQLLDKFANSLSHLPGGYTDREYYPPPFSRNSSGTLKVGNSKNAFRFEYEKKIGNNSVKQGTGSMVVHETYKDNKQAAVGGRYNVLVVEEVGLEDKILTVHGANESTQDMGAGKFGSSFYLGCVCEDSLILNAEGIYVKVQDLIKEEGVMGLNESENKFQPTTTKFKMGTSRKHCYKITTNTGRELSCSDDHPIYTQERYNCGTRKLTPVYKEAKDLKIGERVAVINNVDYFGKETLFDARLLGMLIGDGSFTETTKFITKDKSLLNYIQNKYTVKVDSEENGLYKTRILGLKSKLEDLDLHLQNKLEKHIPEKLHYCNKETIKEFIGGLFDTDGCIHFSEKQVSTLKYTSICKNIVTELQLLLNKFGIQSKIIKESPRKTKLAEGKNVTYNLYIKDKDSILNFHKNITLLVGYKQDNLNKIVKVLSERKSLYRKSDIRWERVVSLEYLGEQIVYNMSAGGDHNYIANGIVTHNTGGDMEKVIESEIIFRDPEAYDFLGFNDIYEGRGTIGFFLPAIYTNLAYKDKMGNTDVETSMKYEMEMREQKKKANNTSAYDEYIMSRPIKPSEMFLSKTGNKFPVVMLREQQATNDRYSYKKHLRTIGVLLEDKDYIYGVKFKPDFDLRPIDRFPHDSKASLASAWEFYEHPPAGFIQPNLYKIVYDPIKDEGGGTSLAAIYVYKSNNTVDANGNELIAWWVGRYDKPDDIHHQCVIAAKYFNAQVMFENNIIDFKNYCMRTGNYHILASTPKQIIEKALRDPSFKYDVGIPMTNPLKQYALRLAQQWLLDEKKTYVEELADGTNREIIERNLNTIKDDLLLEELIQYNDKGNFDRVSAFLLLMLWIEQDKEVVVQEAEEISQRTATNFYSDLYNNRLKSKSLISF